MIYTKLCVGSNQFKKIIKADIRALLWCEKAGGAVCTALSSLTWHWLNKTPSSCTTQQGWFSFSWKASLLSHPYIHRLYLPLIEAPVCVGGGAEASRSQLTFWHSQFTGHKHLCLPSCIVHNHYWYWRAWVALGGKPTYSRVHRWSVISREHQNKLVE